MGSRTEISYLSNPQVCKSVTLVEDTINVMMSDRNARKICAYTICAMITS